MTRYDYSIKLSKSITYRVFEYIPYLCRAHLYDYLQLRELIQNSGSTEKFQDYSFLITPVYKSLEGILWQIAAELQLTNESDKVGSFFDENNIKSKLLSLINDLPEKRKKGIEQRLNELQGILKKYRHEPAHYGKTYDTFESADLICNSAIFNIKCVIEDLLDEDLISPPKTNN